MAENRLAMQKQMLISHTKILDRYIKEGAQDKIADWQPKVDKLRAQIEEQEANAGGANQPASYPYREQGIPGQPPHYPPAQQQYQQPAQQQYQQPAQQQYQQPAQQQYQPAHSQPTHTQPTHTQPTAPTQPVYSSTPNYAPAPTQTRPVSTATEKRAHEILSETNMKLTMELATKDTFIEEKDIEIDNLKKKSQNLIDQLQNTKTTTAERIAFLEKEVSSSRSETEQQRTTLQKEIDHVKKVVEEKDDEIKALKEQLQKIKHDQEDESTRLSVFISKTLGAIKLTNETAQEHGNNNSFVLESQSNLGFSTMTIKSVVNGNGTFSVNL